MFFSVDCGCYLRYVVVFVVLFFFLFCCSCFVLDVVAVFVVVFSFGHFIEISVSEVSYTER